MRWAYYGDATPNDPTVLHRHLFNHSTKLVACDIETISLKDRTIVGIGLATDAHNAFYFPANSPYMNEVIQCLNNPSITKLFHNGLYDIPELQQQYQVDIGNNVMDSLVMAQLCGKPLALTDISIETGAEAWNMGAILKEHKTKSTLDLPPEVLAKKCCVDVQATWAAYEYMKPLVDIDYVKKEMELIPILINMQSVGMKIDHERRAVLAAELGETVDSYRLICREITGDEKFNPASYKQVGAALLKRIGKYSSNSKVMERHKGSWKYSTGEAVLERLHDPLARYVLQYRNVAKQLSTYVTPLEGKERIYTHFSFITDTRRLASKDEALQNWPKHLRAMLVPDESYFLSADYSQQELRVLAYVSGDRLLNEAFQSGADIHAATAAYMYEVPLDRVTSEMRKHGKNANFAVVYGSEDVALQPVKLKWLNTYKEAAVWIKDVQEFALVHGWIPTIGGARLYIKDVGGYRDEGRIRRQAINYTCQGSAAELTKEAMRRCKGLPMILTVHDEILFSGDIENEVRKRDLEHAGPMFTPVDFKLLERWG